LKKIFSYSREQVVEDRAVVQALRSKGFRLTSQRLAVIGVLLAADEHLTPAQVLAQGRGAHPGLGLTTVYRTLELLSELGYVRRIHLDEGCHAYACLREKEGHHLVCQACHRVVDFPCTGLTELVEETAERTGFTVEAHLLELVGLCPACQASDSTRGPEGAADGRPAPGQDVT
jgi:Fe2+ or Zn2+ uptake regulation protein